MISEFNNTNVTWQHINNMWINCSRGIPVVKNPPVNARDTRDAASISGLVRSLGGAHGNPFQVLLPGKSHGQRNLASYGPWGRI